MPIQPWQPCRRPVHLMQLSTVAAAVVVVGGCGPAAPPKAPSPPSPAQATGAAAADRPSEPPTAASPVDLLAAPNELGRELYARHCAACHGPDGSGQGVAAAFLFPKPRDFRAGRFRLVSTSNNVPSRADLHDVLLRGMPGSSMPPWPHLSQQERDALVTEVMRLRYEGLKERYLKALREEEGLSDEEIAAAEAQAELRQHAERFVTPGESSPVPEIPPPDESSVARGRAIYAAAGCLQCHGEQGKGDGGQKMFDDEGYTTAPRDFTAGIFKGGHDPVSLFRRIAYGMPGTPMPSSKQLTPEQTIDLAHYVRSLSTDEQREATVLNRERIAVQAVAALPRGIHDAQWQGVASVSPRMTPLWWRDGADPGLQVQAVHDGHSIAMRLTWRDETPDWRALQGDAFEDAVAVELYRGDAEPFLGMGDPQSPIDVWFWDADRQSADDLEDQYPNVVVDIYPFNEPLVDTAEYQRAGTQRAQQPEVSLPAQATGNQIAPDRAASGGSSLAAGGPGSVTFRVPQSQIVEAQGDWTGGRWTVVMTRRLTVESPAEGVSLEPGGKASAAFAVWDGAVQDRDGKKLITIWQDLVLEE
jgi:mono/diheme cytochrome c family protein